MNWTPGKQQGMELISNKDGIVLATAMDQRGSLGKMIAGLNESITYGDGLRAFKTGLSDVLGNQSSSLLLDPEYGWEAAAKLNDDVGLIMAYEKTGYDTTEKGRLPNLVDNYAVQDIKRAGASALKLLVYYDHQEETKYNQIKKTLIKRTGDECKQNDIPFILEPVSYNAWDRGTVPLSHKATELAKKKPANVAFFMEEFSKAVYGVDVLKVEVPVAIYHIEGHSTDASKYEPVFSAAEAAAHYKACSDKSRVPFIYLSGGVTNDQFIETLHFAKEAGAKFSGSLCGRAIWKDGVEAFARDGHDAFYNWLETQGTSNLKKVQQAIIETATPWHKLA